MVASVLGGSGGHHYSIQADGNPITVPDPQTLFKGDFSRLGDDLRIVGEDGTTFVISDYFSAGDPATLLSPAGAMLSGDIVARLAGPLFPGQYAQASTNDAGPQGKQIGTVETLQGSATAVRTDGTIVQLKVGDAVFENDVIQTAGNSKVGLSFVDGTVFNMSDNARMVLDKLVYNPDGADNSMLFSLVQGSFVFVAGQVAPTGDMKISTPVATMGIRGTTPTVQITTDAAGQQVVNFSIVPDPPDPDTGEIRTGQYTLFDNNTGLPIGQVTDTGSFWQLTSATGQVTELPKSDSQLQNDQNAINEIRTTVTRSKQNQNNQQNQNNNDGTGDQGNNQQGDQGETTGSIEGGPPSGGSGGSGGLGGGLGGTELGGLGGGPETGGPLTGGPGGGPGGGTGGPTGGGQNPNTGGGGGGNGGPPNLNLTGTDFADVIVGGAGNDTINGLGGNDTIDGAGGNDTLFGGTGNDNLTGGDGDDTVSGGDGDDTIIAGSGAGDDDYDGGADTDTITFTSTSQGITVDLSVDADGTTNDENETDGDGVASGSEIGSDTLANIENVIGGSGDDTITGDAGDNTLLGGGGNDTLKGGAGNDTVDGGEGDDTVIGGAGQGGDTYIGGAGIDTITFTSTTQGVNVNLAVNTDGVTADPDETDGDGRATGNEIGTDTLTGFENVTGGSGNDTITGDAGNNELLGGDGNDTLDGGSGGNRLVGGAGNDTLIGGTSGAFVHFNRADYDDMTVNPAKGFGDGNVETDTGGDAQEDSITIENHGFETGERVTYTAGNTAIGGLVDGTDYFVIRLDDDIFQLAATEGDATDSTPTPIDLTAGGVGPHSLQSQKGITANLDSGQSSVSGNTSVGTDTLQDVEHVRGTDFDDTFSATGSFQGQFGGFNQFDPGAGNDTINGNGETRVSYDTITGFSGTDGVTINLQAGFAEATNAADAALIGNDKLSNVNSANGSSANDTLIGRDGQDDSFRGLAGDDDIRGGTGGNDRADYRNSPNGVTVDLSVDTDGTTDDSASTDGDGVAQDGFGGTDTLTGIERVRGSEFDDDITGDGGANTLEGRDGDDELFGLAGDDTLRGDAGDDLLDGGAGTNDTADYFGEGERGDRDGVQSKNGITADLSGGAIGSGTVTDTFGDTDTLVGIENIRGTDFDDVLIGDAGANELTGKKGFNQFEGRGGDDTLIGGTGGDVTSDRNLASYQNAAGESAQAFLGGNVTINPGATDTITMVDHGYETGERVTYTTNFIAIGGLTPGTDYFVIRIDADTIRLADTAANAAIGTAIDLTSTDAGTHSLQSQSGITATLTGALGSGSSSVTGLASVGTDTLFDVEEVRGTGFDDTFTASGSFESQFGNAFNEFEGLGGNDLITGNGSTRISYALASAAVTVNFGTGKAFGSGSPDPLVADPTDAANVGVDSFTGVNAVRGSDHDDTLLGSNNDTFERFRGQAGDDFIDGGTHANDATNFNDQADYRNSPDGIVADFSTTNGAGNFEVQDGFGTVDQVRNVEGIRGSELNDTVTTNATFAMRVEARDGDDTIILKGLADQVDAGDGDDLIQISSDAGWQIDGGDGIDTIQFAGDLDFDTETAAEESEVTNFEIIDLNTTHANSLTVNPEDLFFANDDNEVRILGGTNDTLNVASEGIEIGDGEFPFTIDGFWRQNGTITETHNGQSITFDTFEYVSQDFGEYEYEGEGGGITVHATAHVQQGITVNVRPPAEVNLSDIVDGNAFVSGFKLEGRDAGDDAGISVATVGDFNGDGFDDIIVGSRYGDGNGANTGRADVIFGGPNPLAGTINLLSVGSAGGATPGFGLNGDGNNDLAGIAVSSAGDVNGDGIEDLIVGAINNGASNEGTAYVVFGGSALAKSNHLSWTADGLGFLPGFQLNGVSSGDSTARGVASAGDFNGDGIDDLIIGADGSDAGGANSGTAYLVFGGQAALTGNVDLGLVGNTIDGFEFIGEDAGDQAGFSVSSAGDFNNDGIDDIIVSAHLNDDGQADTNEGAAYVIFGGQSLSGTVSLSSVGTVTSGFKLVGETALSSGDRAGFDVSNVGDINGDGIADLAVGAQNANENNSVNTNHGTVYLIFGGQALSGQQALANVGGLGSISGFQFVGEQPNDFAAQVSSAGDFNGDGIDDLIIASNQNDDGGPDAGAAYVIFGGQDFAALDAADGANDGQLSLSNVGAGGAAGINGFQLSGETNGDGLEAVSSAGDINGDGFDDLIVGAQGNDSSGIDAGAAYVIFGGNVTNSVTHQATTEGETLNGDANANVIVGSAGDDTLNGNGGADVLRGGAGDDKLAVGDANFMKVDGGTGLDTLLVNGDLNLTNISNLKLESIEAIDLTNGAKNSLTISLDDVFDLSETGNSEWANAVTPPDSHNNLVIRGDSASDTGGSADAVFLQGPPASGAWQEQASTVDIGTDTFTVHNFVASGSGDVLASVAIQQDVDVNPPV